jgi:hypothetical protein
MPRRLQRGRDVVVSAPQTRAEGRPSRAKVTPPPRSSSPTVSRFPVATSLPELAFALAVGLGELSAAQARELASPSPGSTSARRLAQRHVRDVRGRLRARAGREVEVQLVAALVADGGLALRGAVAAGPDLRPYAIRALLDVARIAREHGVESVAALVLLARSARWAALAAWALDACLAAVTAAERAELAKLAAQAGREARLDLVGALQVARERRVTELPAIDVAGAVRRFEAERAAERPADPPEGEPDAGDGEAPTEGDDDADDGEPGHP